MSDTLSNALRGGSLLDRIANPTIVNPLAAYQGAAQTANSIWTNREAQAKQAAGEAFQSSINDDGTPNQTALLQALKANPQAALAAQQSAQLGQNLDQTTYETHMKRLGAGAAGFTQILAQNHGDAPLDAIKTYLANGVRDGHITQQEAGSILQQFGPDAAQNGNIGRQMVARNMEVQTALKAGRPSVTYQDVGGRMVPLTTQGELSPQPGQMTAGGGPSLQKGLTPEGGSQRVITGYDPQTGQPIYGPAISVAPPQFGGPGGASPVGPGRLPPALQGPGGGQGGAQGGAPASGGGGTDQTHVAAPDPRIAEQNKADQELFLADQKGIPTRQTGVQSLLNAQHALELTTTGSKIEAIHNIKSFLSAQGVSTAGMDESVANYDKFRKAALDYARQQASGAGTNLQLEAAEHSNANPEMVNAANRSVIQTNIGRERQAMAANMMAPDQKLGGGYISHKSQFASDTDPRGFAVDSYTGPELKKLTDGMTKDEKAKFYKSVGIAQRLKLLNPAQ